MKKKYLKLLLVGACLGLFWVFGGQTASASAKIVKLSELPVAKAVHLKVNYLYGTRYGNQVIDNGAHVKQKLYGLAGKMKIGKYSKRIFYIYRQAIVKNGNKRMVYYYVTDKDRMVGGWVHRSRVTNVKNVGYTKEIKTIYNVVKNNATTWSFTRVKQVLGDTNPSYPYSEKRYSHNIGGGWDVLPDVGVSHLGRIVTILALGMTKNHYNVGEPPFNATSSLKDGRTLLLLYQYYQKRGPYFDSTFEKDFRNQLGDTAKLNSGTDEGINTSVHRFSNDLETHINQLDLEYNS